MKKETIKWLRPLATIVVMIIVYFAFLPALNLGSPGFWLFLFIGASFYLLTGVLNLLDPRSIIKNHVDLSTMQFKMDRKYYIYFLIPLV